LGVAIFCDAADRNQCVQFVASENGTLVMELDCGASRGSGGFDSVQLEGLAGRGFRLTHYGNGRREGVPNDPEALVAEVEDLFRSILRRPPNFRLRVYSGRGG
jgi:hypothetical protein